MLRKITDVARQKADRERFEFWIDRKDRKRLQAIQKRDGIPESEQVRRAVAVWLDADSTTKAASGRAGTRPKA